MTRPTNHAGKIYGDLTITTRAGNYTNGVALWNATCTCGHPATVRSDFLNAGRTHDCGNRTRHPRRRQPTPAYTTVHARIARHMGKASEHPCAWPGCTTPAAEHAFLGCDEAITTNGRAPYCAHACPSEYAPMCRPHADHMDQIVRDLLAEASVSPLSA